MPDRVTVPSGEFIRNVGYWQGEALRRPIAITYHGRERLILAASETFRTSASGGDGAAPDQLAALRADAAVMLENLEEAFFDFDSTLRAVNSNVVAEVFLGLSREDLRGALVDSLFPQPYAAILRDRIVRVMKTRKPELVDGVVNGRHVSSRVIPLSSGVAVLLRNTTWQHEFRTKIEEADAVSVALSKARGMAVIHIDARARIERVSDKFCAWTGFRPEDLAGHKLTDIVRVDERRSIAESLERTLRDGEASDLVLNVVAKLGQQLQSDVVLAPVVTDYVPRGAIAICTFGGVTASGGATASQAVA